MPRYKCPHCIKGVKRVKNSSGQWVEIYCTDCNGTGKIFKKGK